jgi:acyl-CoA reductase-like NAD-dependent aldehyde dehydrogenase
MISKEYAKSLFDKANTEKIIFGNILDKKFLMPTAVLVKDPNKSVLLKDELFGPVLPIIKYKKISDA